jgi:hypothetical protein
VIKHIEQVIPAAIAISCHFRLFGFRCRFKLADNFREQPIAARGEESLNSLRKFLSGSFGWLIAVIWFLCRAALVTWATLAIYYSNLPSAGMRLALASVFAAFTIWAVWFSRQRRMSVIAIALFLGVAVWWMTILPSHDRHWRPEVAVMPRALIDATASD